jgi:hypothetical protein
MKSQEVNPMSVVAYKRVRVVQSAGVGRLIVYGVSWSKGKTTTIYRLDEHGKKGSAYYASVNEFKAEDGKSLYAAVFPMLAPGNYRVYEPGYTSCGERTITIFPGNTAEVTYT